MPAISDILDSVQVPALIKDSVIKSGTFSKNAKGLQYYSGGFTVVFPVTVGSEKWAFRCWHTPLKDSKKRYTLMSKSLQESLLPFFCSFSYSENGIIVNGESYPTTKMRWVDGMDLKKYICYHYQESNLIKKLAKDFLEMTIDLHTHKIAHGDLQHGNILISDTGKIFLVDYDSMYVPTMGNSYPDIITGLVDYQHPARKNNRYSSHKLDYFSELIIYTSLLAISEKPELVSKYNVADSEALLFTSSDFDNFNNSQIYQELNNLGNNDINKCLKIIEDYLSYDDINSLEPIESYFMSINIDYPISVPNDESFTIKWVSTGIDTIEISDYGKVKLSDNITLKLSENKVLTFILSAKTGYTCKKNINIKVIQRAIIKVFQADRNFSYPNLPIKLSWEVENSKDVSLNDSGVNKSKGYVEVFPGTDTIYTLKARDSFGEVQKTLSIQMLPLPAIKSILMPMPDIEKNLAIAYNPPNLKVNVPVPSFESSLVKLEITGIPSLKRSSNFVNLIAKKEKRPIRNPFKSLYSYFFGNK